MEGFNDEPDIPKRILIQPTSRPKGIDDAPLGAFVDITNKRVIGKSMDVIILAAASKRKLFYPEGSPMKGVQCFSDDGIFPSSAVASPIAAQCRGCVNENKDNIAELLCLDVAETKASGKASLFIYEAKKTAIKPVGLYLNGISRVDKNARDFQATIGTAKNETAKGKWFTPEFSNVLETPAALAQIAENEFNRLVGSGDEEFTGEPVDDSIPF